MNHSGVARVFDAEDGRLLTRDGRLVGTAEYMSPELAQQTATARRHC